MPKRARAWPGLIAALGLVTLLGAAQSAAGHPKGPQPIWQVDLAPFGCLRVALPFEGPGREYRRWRHTGGLVFTQPGVLAAYFVVREPNTDLSARNRVVPSDPYHVRAVFLDAERGSVVGQGGWPTRPNGYSALFAAQGGNFVVFAADALSLYSPHISLLARYVPPWLGKIVFGTFVVLPSPAGDTLLIKYCEGREGRCAVKAQLLDAASLSPLGSLAADLPEPPDPFTVVWGQEVAWTSRQNYLYIWERGAEPRILAHGTWLLGPPVAFLDADTIAVRSGLGGQDSELVILSTRGSILRRLRLGPEVADFVIPSQGGKFFALDSHIPGWFDSPRPRRVTIRVFRVDGQGPLLRLDVPERRFPSAVALSPDGSLLALTVGTVVRVYRVPIPPAQAGGK
jgi:hypothetical protein